MAERLARFRGSACVPRVVPGVPPGTWNSEASSPCAWNSGKLRAASPCCERVRSGRRAADRHTRDAYALRMAAPNSVLTRERKMGLKRLAQSRWDAEVWNKSPIPPKGVRTIFCKVPSFAPLRPLREIPFRFLTRLPSGSCSQSARESGEIPSSHPPSVSHL